MQVLRWDEICENPELRQKRHNWEIIPEDIKINTETKKEEKKYRESCEKFAT